MNIAKCFVKKGYSDISGKDGATQLHHILGRDERHHLIKKEYGIDINKYPPFVIELTVQEHIDHAKTKVRKKIVRWVYDTQGIEGLIVFIVFGRLLGNYPLEVIEAWELIEEVKPELKQKKRV